MNASMKKYVMVFGILTLGLIAAMPSVAQIQFNPQIGINFTKLSVDPRSSGVSVDVEGKSGFLVGADLRVGGAFYLQPGFFVTGTKTVVQGNADVKRYGGKLKGLVGFKLLNGESFKLRVAGGPTYDFQLSLNVDQNPYFDKEKFKSGIFGLDAGVGIDLAIFTAEFGYNWAFTETFNTDVVMNKPRFQTLYLTVGVVLGK
jgi:hypothetical protein